MHEIYARENWWAPRLGPLGWAPRLGLLGWAPRLGLLGWAS